MTSTAHMALLNLFRELCLIVFRDSVFVGKRMTRGTGAAVGTHNDVRC
jgi:hypothetical protein